MDFRDDQVKAWILKALETGELTIHTRLHKEVRKLAAHSDLPNAIYHRCLRELVLDGRIINKESPEQWEGAKKGQVISRYQLAKK